jgi:hypothetical protein
MSTTFENLFGLQFCQYNCGTYIGFSDEHLSADGESHKPLEARTGNVHDCPKEGWSKQKFCFQCNKKIIFHNSHKYPNGKKIRFDSPGVRHKCSQESDYYEYYEDSTSESNDEQYENTQEEENYTYSEINDEKVIEAYTVFELNHNATIKQIKSQHKKLVLKYHPDRNKNSDTTTKMSEINSAYEIIMEWIESTCF